MKKLRTISLFLFLLSCQEAEELNCKCEFISYERKDLESNWVEINKITRMTRCDETPFFVISNTLLSKDIVSCN